MKALRDPLWFGLIAAVMLVAAAAFGVTVVHAAEKAPPCWPKQLGSTGSSFRTGSTPDGRWVAWTCVVSGKQQVYGVWAVSSYEIVHPDTTGMTPIKTAGAYWTANVGNTTLGSEFALQRLRAEAMKAFQ